MIQRVSLSFARVPDAELDNFTQTVIAQMTANPAFPSPTVTMANLQAAKNDFTAKIAAAQTGGPPDTAAKNNSRQALLGLLRQLASYVQLTANNDMAVLLSSGFQAMSTNRAQNALEQPQSLVLKNGASGQLVARVDPITNTSMYEGRIKAPTPDWMTQSVFTGDSHYIIF